MQKTKDTTMRYFPRGPLLGLTVAALAFVLTACDVDTEDGSDTDDTGEAITHTLTNSGYACLLDDGNDDTSTGAIQVVLAPCLSGCASNLSATCEAQIMDQSIEVTAEGEYSLPADDVECTAACVELVADCDISGIGEDTWTMNYAGEEVEIDYPSSSRTCTSDASPG
jgi:hypothetical protein